MNLHSLVRPAVNAVNPDCQGWLLSSAGWTMFDDGHREPRYLAKQSVMIQVQPLSGGDIRHAEFLNLQGVLRAVYLFGDTQGIVRFMCKGGDMLQFPEYPGAPMTNWLVTEAAETWGPGWSKVIVTMQSDRPQ